MLSSWITNTLCYLDFPGSLLLASFSTVLLMHIHSSDNLIGWRQAMPEDSFKREQLECHPAHLRRLGQRVVHWDDTVGGKTRHDLQDTQHRQHH